MPTLRLDQTFRLGADHAFLVVVTDPGIDSLTGATIEWRIADFERIELILLVSETDTDIITVIDPVQKQFLITLSAAKQDEILLEETLYRHEGYVRKGVAVFPFEGTLNAQGSLQSEFPTIEPEPITLVSTSLERLHDLLVVGRYWLAIKILIWLSWLLQWNRAPLWLMAQAVVLSEGIVEQINEIKDQTMRNYDV